MSVKNNTELICSNAQPNTNISIINKIPKVFYILYHVNNVYKKKNVYIVTFF